jgi:transcriptional regulator with XRE-family HTH domain
MISKNVFASNLNKYMRLHDKSRKDISEALGISYFTVSDWVNGKKYPRMDKVEMLANYFGILKSDLIEDKSEEEKSPPTEPQLSEGEALLIALFRQLPEERRNLAFQTMKAVLENLK